MSDTQEIRYLGEMQKLTIGKDDTLVITTEMRITGEQCEWIRRAVEKLNLGCHVLILDNGMKAGVLTKGTT